MAGRNRTVQSPESKVFYVGALFFFALGLMSKPMLVTVPFVLLLLDYYPLKRADSWKKLLLEKTLFFALALIFSPKAGWISQRRRRARSAPAIATTEGT